MMVMMTMIELPIIPITSSATIARSKKPQMADFEFILDSSLRRLLCKGEGLVLCTIRL